MAEETKSLADLKDLAVEPQADETKSLADLADLAVEPEAKEAETPPVVGSDSTTI